MIQTRRRTRHGSPRRRSTQGAKREKFWIDINRRIQEGKVIPIISNSVRNDRIFDLDYDRDIGIANDEEFPFNPDYLTIGEELAWAWADDMEYPLPDKHCLVRVATYNQVISDDLEQAKRNYLDFLKNYLLDLAEDDLDLTNLDVDLVALRKHSINMSFREVANELDSPKFNNEYEDPLLLLAQLPLPIYITTSHHDFMEQALQSVDKHPRTQVCFWWSDDPISLDETDQIPNDFRPTVNEPLVYHLYGFDKYPESLVLSEEDYLKFLIKMSQNITDTTIPIIPLYLREQLTVSSLILLGYRLEDWDFLVLFRGVIEAQHSSLQKFSLAIQLDPAERKGITEEEEKERAKQYLKEYFKSSKSTFRVTWGNTETFVKNLWQQWNEWRNRYE